MLMKVREEIVKLVGKVERTTVPEHPPLTEAAQRALDWAIDEKLKSGKFLLNLQIFIFSFFLYGKISSLMSS